MNIILVGAQGSGKGTQAERLVQALHVKHCASGELLRTAIAQGTAPGRAAQPYYDRGDLVPDDLIIAMFLDCIDDRGDATGIILDGFPRNVVQAKALDDRLAARRQQIDWVVYLEVPRDVLLDRLSGRYVCTAPEEHVWNIKTRPPRVPFVCDYDGTPLRQRSDDTPEKIARRLDIFFTDTIRLVDYYMAQGKLLRVDGARGIDEVTQAILDGVIRPPFERAFG